MGLAYLPDGTSMDYKDYIANHPHWQTVRAARYKFDSGRCVVCHRELPNGYETHHLNYMHLGNEHMRDVITLCSDCHTKFHNNWRKQDFWKGRELGHWNTFSLEHTARLCAGCWKEDRLISKDPAAPNICNQDICRQYIDTYLKSITTGAPILIDPNDLSLFIRNKRYELFFEAEVRGLTLEEFLNEYYGPKVRGKNPIRQEAGRKGGPFDHKPASLHRHYKENRNINMLMKEVKNLEENENAET